MHPTTDILCIEITIWNISRKTADYHTYISMKIITHIVCLKKCAIVSSSNSSSPLHAWPIGPAKLKISCDYTWRHFRFFAFSHSPLQKSFSQKKFVQKRKNEKPDFLYRNCQKWTKNWRKVPKNVKKIFIFILFQSKLAQKQLYKKFWIKNWIPEIFWPFLTHL